MGAFEAALIGAGEIGFTIVSISLSLVAVFIPVLLMGGVIGRIFNEFAVVVTVAILVSMFVSLTLTPMMASRILGEASQLTHERKGLNAMLERGFDAVIWGYGRMLDVCLKFRFIILLLFFATIGVTVLAFSTIPKGFFPRGYRPTASHYPSPTRYFLCCNDKVAGRGCRCLCQITLCCACSKYVGSTSGAMNAGRLFVELKSKTERPPMAKVLSDLRPELSAIPASIHL